MAKEVAGLIKLQIKGGAANPSPPVGPALGSKGINIMEFCKQFNARTQDKAGKILPVIITYYADKSFDFVIKTPPVAIQLLELTNALQQSQAKKGGGEAIRLSSSMVMKLAQIVLGTKLADAKAMNDCRRQLSELIPLIQKCSSEEFTQYVSQLRAALDKSCFSGSDV